MDARKLSRFCLSVILVLGMFVDYAPMAKAADAVRRGQVAEPPHERIVTGVEGINKLSPDLRALVSGDLQPGAGVALDQTTSGPLLVSALISPGADIHRFFTHSVRSREVAGVQWVTGELSPTQLIKLASVPDVFGVISTNTYQTTEAPGLDELRQRHPSLTVKEAQALLAQGGTKLLKQRAAELKAAAAAAAEAQPSRPAVGSIPAEVSGTAPGILDIHDVKSARAEGYTGEGVVTAVIDTGVDFANPDLKGTQARIPDTSADYAGWPFAYDTVSAALYALDPINTLGPDHQSGLTGMTQYVHTLPVLNSTCDAQTCRGGLVLAGDPKSAETTQFSWPNTSKSGKYYYSIDPDFSLALAAYSMNINYTGGGILQPMLIVSDEQQPGVYDTVYVDVNYNYHIGDLGEKMTKAQPVSGVDLAVQGPQDGTWDLSGGMLGWISDGLHQPPGVATVYPDVADYEVPPSGRLLVFINDSNGHGTNCASQIAGQGRITDPKVRGPVNPLFAGGSEIGGVGGAVVESMAPGAKIAAFENGFSLPFDAWTLAVLGFDGKAGTGDEANIISNSWGNSNTIEDGWDVVSRFAQQLSYQVAPDVTFLVATGNGGHGYGTVTSPDSGPILNVGASTAYGRMRGFEIVGPQQFLFGEVQPWSNRGPGALGDIAPDITAVGAWGLGANPLNIYYGDGQAAYDVFGGTSMATPIAAGGLAMIYQAYRQQHQRWPTWQEARDLLLNSTKDLGYDIFTQGSGNIQIGQAIKLVNDQSPSLTPVQWEAGSDQDTAYPAFPNIMHAGETSTRTFTVKNPTTAAVSVDASSQAFQDIHDETFTFSFATPAPSSRYNLPIYLENLTDLITTYHPDLVRAQVVFPYNTFDSQNNLFADSQWGVYFYDWSDNNGNGRLWTDTNRDGKVEEGEIDIDSQTGLYEFNRFTYGYPQGTAIEASLGREGLSQRHNGVFLGLNCMMCGSSTTLQVRVTFYQKANWPWLSLSDSSLVIPAGESGTFTAHLTVPATTQPGIYDGEIVTQIQGRELVIPVVANVAASSSTFKFGGSSELKTPYDNSHIFGGFNWKWRYEAGDWRFFYYDLPQGTAGPGKAMVYETQWDDPKTDLDTWILGQSRDNTSKNAPQIFGPYGMKVVGGSTDGYSVAGKFQWKTNTGYSRELIGGPVQDGLGMIALHNVMYGGAQLAEGLRGQVYQVSTNPSQVVMESKPDGTKSPFLSGSQNIQLTSTADLDEGIVIQPFGLSEPVDLTNQVIRQDSNMDICSASWGYRLNEGGIKISHGGVLEISTHSTAPDLDLDLYLFKDDGDGKFECGWDPVKAYSMGSAANEQIKINFPTDGTYWLIAHGAFVPEAMQNFDIHIRAIEGTALSLRDMPLGPILANQPIQFTTSFQSFYPADAPATMEGVLLIGPPVQPDLIEVPVLVRPTVMLFPAPGLELESPWVGQYPVPASLSIQNQGAQAETVHAQITLPDGMGYQPGSAQSPGNAPVYDAAAGTITWDGQLGGTSNMSINFLVSGKEGYPPGMALLSAQVDGVIGQQSWKVTHPVWINSYGLVLPLISR